MRITPTQRVGSWIDIATHRHVPPRSLPISTTSEEMPELRVGELVNQPVMAITRVTRCQQRREFDCVCMFG